MKISYVDEGERQWSPADNPYAIAVSEAQWWERAAQLALRRLDDADDGRISWFSSRQIDARQLIIALRQVLVAERLQQAALEELDMDQRVRDELDRERQQFETALPGIRHMRDALMHFDEWSRGKGRGPQKERVQAGALMREVASEFSGFGYDPQARTITFGPYLIRVDVVNDAVTSLVEAIYVAARAVDDRNLVRLHAEVAEALGASEVLRGVQGAALRVRIGNDRRVWISLRSDDETGHDMRRLLARAVVDAIAKARLVLIDVDGYPTHSAERQLARGRPLACRRAAE